ncbi:hypothetical protein DBR47_15215 [Paucibacter sp. KBW04]|uniref:hypothetical protein n=1 Tax=Paucibacter sp. KBW04 TaxID=2153361 RepID=UPI000F56B4BE|nr:hypothetical protein [Paucibacter sp. KBW04]RQO57187.1 hypothetical protein DBR47_15215 [Paucibacter sp. KBW04]
MKTTQALVRLALAGALVGALSACSLAYDIGQQTALQRCESLVNIEDRNACRRANSQSYEKYEQDREKLRQGKKD